jgi:hypothetical protein
VFTLVIQVVKVFLNAHNKFIEGFEVLTAVGIKCSIFRDITLCILLKMPTNVSEEHIASIFSVEG